MFIDVSSFKGYEIEGFQGKTLSRCPHLRGPN